jgi:hypothetical protein
VLHELKPGDNVMKNELTWVVTEFDAWGRGVGIGLVVEPPFAVDDIGQVDVQWPTGRCFEPIEGLLPAPDGDDAASGKTR